MRTGVRTPGTHVRWAGWGQYGVQPAIQVPGDRDGEFPSATWLAEPAVSVCSRLTRDPASKNKVEGRWENILNTNTCITHGRWREKHKINDKTIPSCGWRFLELFITSGITSKKGPARSSFSEDEANKKEANKNVFHLEHGCRERGWETYGGPSTV